MPENEPKEQAQPPMQAPPSPEPKPQTVKIKHGDREIEVSPELAEVWQNREQDFSRKLSEQGSELGQLRKVKQEYDGIRSRIVQPEPEAIPIETQIFTDPKTALTRLRQEIRQELTTEYQQAEGKRKFWERFYRSHTDLNPDDDQAFVEATYAQHQAELEAAWQSQGQSKAMDRLADLTREAILRTAKRFQPAETVQEVPARPTVVESGGNGRRTVAAPVAPEKPQTLSQIIRERRAKQRGEKAPARG